MWTDLKLDNMLLCQRDEARAIDLEGAVPARSAPKSYTPDTMPPDFALASRGGVSPFAFCFVIYDSTHLFVLLSVIGMRDSRPRANPFLLGAF